MELLMLIGTQTGNTEKVAEAVAQHLADHGATVHYVDLADAYPEMLADYERLILATSTWGDGELPDNALDFYEALAQLNPDLSHLRFGILALGDHTYDPHFCKAGLIFAEKFVALGANAVIAQHEIDAGPTRKDIQMACAWGLQTLAALIA